jgi:hypothetical protein
LKPGDVAEIEGKVNQVTGKQVDDDFLTEIDFNLHQRAKAFVVRAIVDWEGFQGVNEKPLPCNDQNKLKVLKEFQWFSGAVEEFRKELAEEIEAEAEELEKN